MTTAIERMSPGRKSDRGARAVLCVDDEPAVLSAIRRAFRGEPLELITMEDPRKAAELIGERSIRVVITDQRMPNMLGTELARYVRERSPETACVLLTAYAPTKSVRDAVAEGLVDRLIPKPWKDEDLRLTLRALMDSGVDEAAAEACGTSGDTTMIWGFPGTADLDDVVFRVDCKGKTPDAAFASLARAFDKVERERRGIVIVLSDLLALRGPISALLMEIVLSVESRGLPALVVDPSGLAAAFCEIMCRPLSVLTPKLADAGSRARGSALAVVGDRARWLMIREVLDAAGYGSAVAASAEAAIHRLRAQSVDVLVVDLDLPDEGALDVLAAAARFQGDARVALLRREEHKSPFPETRSMRHLRKPCRALDLLDFLQGTR